LLIANRINKYILKPAGRKTDFQFHIPEWDKPEDIEKIFLKKIDEYI